jgi:DivIVA domain-containing protein
MFVVQRTFSRVRRGYDPAEVDRHLELVSRWFTSTQVGQALSHERAELQERERRLGEREGELARALEGARLEADGLVEGARRRADADTGGAERALAAAREEAAAIRASGRARARRAARRGARRGGRRGGHCGRP